MIYKSHDDKLLKVHLCEVSKAARSNIENAGRSDLSSFASMAGALHDIGKYTDSFQKHLETKKPVGCSNHALISSLITYNETYSKTNDGLYSLLTMLSVASHHTHLHGLTFLRHMLIEKQEGQDRCLEQQYDDLKDKWDKVILKELDWLKLSSLPDLNKLISAPLEMLRKYPHKFEWKQYLDGLLLFSCLIDADKHSAADVEANPAPLPQAGLISKYAEELQKKDANTNDLGKTLINDTRKQLFNWAKGFDQNGEIMSLVAPTGSGKTLTGSLLALKSGKRKVIYSLPFINIINQTVDVLSKALDDSNVFGYHHLTFNWKKMDENDDLERKLMIAESWDYPVIVTTFEALVSTFLSSENSYLKRLHNMANSFIVLDEIQSLPLDYIPLIYSAINEMTEYLNIKVLFMSATMPIKVENNQKPVSLKPNRYRLVLNELENSISPADFASNLDLSRGSVMIELNTIASAEEVFNRIREHKPYYLSTRVIPKERWNRVKEIKEKLDKKERVVLVSTQLVEAGVDLDFANAYRDLGPIDALVQAAGRVNRNYGKEMGELSVYSIQRGNETDFTKVYGQLSEHATRKTIKKFLKVDSITGSKVLEEKDVEELLSIYYQQVKEYFNPNESREGGEVLENIRKLDFDKVKVNLIQAEPKNTVYVEYDDEAKETWNRLKNELKERKRNRTFIKYLMGNAQQYTVNTWENLDLEFDDDLGWYYLPNSSISSYYNPIIGLMSKDKSSEALIW